MKILHCLHNYYPARGGAEWLMQNVSERLARRGHSVRVIATNATSTEDYFLRGCGKALLPEGAADINGVSVRRVRFSRRGASFLNLGRAVANRIPYPFGEHIRMLSWGPRSRAYERRILQAGDVDLIVACPLPTLNVRYAWRAAKKRNLPLVIVPCFHTEDKMTYHNRLYFEMLREADAVVALTDLEKNDLHRTAGVKIENLHILGAGIDADGGAAQAAVLPAEAARARFGLATKNLVLFVGQHGLHKGILTLIEAMGRVWNVRKDTGLIIAGNPTAHTRDIEKKIGALNAADRAKIRLIKGFPESEKKALFEAADVFVSVSPFESFGIVFLESWLQKIPVIGCKRGASAMIIDELKDGLLVADGKPMELAGALLELIDHPAVRERMGLAGHRKTVDRYAWDKIVIGWEKLYDDVVRRKRHS